MPEPAYDALVVVSFGGPEGRDDVLPFLDNVLRGRPVSPGRREEVAEHYYQFGGVSPINRQNRQLIAALRVELARHAIPLRLYWGNRNWHPLLPNALRQMAADGVVRALAFVTSSFSSYSGCRQYREDIERAREACGPGAPAVDKIRGFFNHPGFIDAQAERIADALARLSPQGRQNARLVFTAHSIPQSMADRCSYVAQLREAARLLAARAGNLTWDLVFQSRSGTAAQPWLEPDVCDYLRMQGAQRPNQAVVIVPVGFVSDHMEVMFDLDVEAANLAGELRIEMVRAATVGVHPRFVTMVRQLVEERLAPGANRLVVGDFGPLPDVCPLDCCPAPVARPAPPPSEDSTAQ